MLAHPDRRLVFLELRDQGSRSVTFSAYDVEGREFLWNEISFEEPWWISLAEVSGNVLILTIYTSTNNPDQKSIIAVNIDDHCQIWWRNNFAISGIQGACVTGTDQSLQRDLCLDLYTGKPADNVRAPAAQNFWLKKPLQYYGDTAHFKTVSNFLRSKSDIVPVSLIEYMEYDGLIILSCYHQGPDLANFLFVFNQAGDKLLEEMIGSNLKGIAPDSFFILSGFLIFVKNSRELISYRMIC